MKSILGMTALAALIMGAAVTTVQAEGGSDRLMFNQQRIQAQASQPAASNEGERFAQLMEEQPTAAGSAIQQQDQQNDMLEPSYKSPILKDRELYGSPH